MLGRVQRNVDTTERAQLLRPHARAVDHGLRLHISSVGGHAGHALILAVNASHRDLLNDGSAAHLRALRQRQRGVGRVGLPIVRQINRADQIARVHHRPHARSLGSGDDFHFYPEALRHGRTALQLLEAFRVVRDSERATLLESGGTAGLIFQIAE